MISRSTRYLTLYLTSTEISIITLRPLGFFFEPENYKSDGVNNEFRHPNKDSARTAMEGTIQLIT